MIPQWLFIGTIIIGAVILLVIIDRFRGPMCCAICREPIQGLFSIRKIDGKKQRVCRKCDAAGSGSP